MTHRYTTSEFDATTLQVLDCKTHTEVCVVTSYDEEALPREDRAALICRGLNLLEPASRAVLDLPKAETELRELLSRDLVYGPVAESVRLALELVTRSRRRFE